MSVELPDIGHSIHGSAPDTFCKRCYIDYPDPEEVCPGVAVDVVREQTEKIAELKALLQEGLDGMIDDENSDPRCCAGCRSMDDYLSRIRSALWQEATA